MKKKIIWGVGIFFIVFFLIVMIQTFRDWRDSTSVDRLVKELQKQEQEILDKKTADKIGGKTPQETLDLFIKAVEAGDYELASKYFVLEKQEEELKSLQMSLKEDIQNVIGLLKQVEKGSYLGEKNYLIDYPIVVDFVLYPSDNWKIEKI